MADQATRLRRRKQINFVLFFVVCSLSGMLFVVEYNTRYLDFLRQSISHVSNPIVYLGNYPLKLSVSASEYYQEHDQLLEKIDSLNRQLLEMYGVAQQYAALKHRHDQLQQALAVPVPLDFEMQLVEVIGLIQDMDRLEAVINVGEDDGIKEDMVVLAPNGIYGRVTEVQKHSSVVITVFDKRHAVPVTNLRSGLNTIAAGNGINQPLSLEHIHRRSDIAADDVMVTSGIGQVFPPGYVLGKVISTEEDTIESLIKVAVQPNVTFQSETFVYVILGPKQSA